MRGLPLKDWARLGPQFDELLSLSPEGRTDRLAVLDRSEPADAAALRELLGWHDAAGQAGFLDGAASGDAMPAALQAGDTLGPWTLQSLLGEGGMGTVWLARRHDGRHDGLAAIKLLRTGLFDRAAQARFRREGAILAQLQHPGIAPLLDAGISPRGQPYLVLAYVQGVRIDDWCRTHRLGPAQRIALGLQVLDAVAAAHAQLVIHRDLKPANILVDQDGRVRLLDFGLARLQDGEPGQTVTRDGGQALTPAYAAPEQFTGGVLSMATDVFALGVVLYELLTGQRPDGLGDAAPLAHLQARLQASAGSGFMRASERASASPDAPCDARALRGDLDNILAKATAFAPADRYAGAAAMADDLRRHLAHEPVLARPAALHYRLGKFVRRNRLGVALGALVLASVVAGTTATALQARRAERATVQAERERDAARRDLRFATGADELLSLLVSASAEQPLDAAALLARAEQHIEANFAGDAGTRARLQFLVGTQYSQYLDADKALPDRKSVV